MLLLKLNKEIDGKILFNYYPEKKESFGILEIDRITGEIEVIKAADTDEFNSYMHHAVSAITKYFENDHYDSEQIVAWY